MRSNNDESSKRAGGSSTQQASKKPSMASAAFDSDDQDDFNPIKDLMPPTLANGDIEQHIGKKRGRENDPLRRLIEDSSADE